MVNYSNNNHYKDKSKTGEVIFSKHNLEFLRFFNMHKKLCDEISGIKPHRIQDRDVTITKYNFGQGINILGAFIYDFLHYVQDKSQHIDIIEDFNNLEKRFNADVNYKMLSQKADNMSVSQEIIFTKMYLKYLINAFEVAHKLSMYLQKTINISGKEIDKNISFVDYEGFFNNLNDYRNDNIRSLANMTYENVMDDYKRILGYFYTYRYIMGDFHSKTIKAELDYLFDIITSDEVIKNVIKIKENADLTKSQYDSMMQDYEKIKNFFRVCYPACNAGLATRNILPKTERIELVDNTLI